MYLRQCSKGVRRSLPTTCVIRHASSYKNFVFLAFWQVFLLFSVHDIDVVQAIPTILPSVPSKLKYRGGAVAPSPEHRLEVPKRESDSLSPSKKEDSQDSQGDSSLQNLTNELAEATTTTEPKFTEATVELTSSEISTNNATTASLAEQTEVATTTDSSSKQEKDDVSTDKEDPRIMMLIRVLFLCYYGSLGSLMPYLPVYYHSLGHGGEILGMIGAIKPLTTFIVAPFWGVMADKSDNPFFILKATFLISLMGQLLVSVRHETLYIMFMVFLTAVFNAPVKSLIDSMVMEHIKDQTHYGKLRLWGQMGFGLGSSGVGVLLSKSKGKAVPGSTSIPPSWVDTIANLPRPLSFSINYLDQFWQSLHGYKLLFLSYAALSIPTWLAIQASQRLDKEKEQQQHEGTKVEEAEKEDEKQQEDNSAASTSKTRMTEGLSLLLHNSDALLFFFLVFTIGVSSGCIENFAYVRIREVGGTGREMGLSRLVSSLAGAPMFWFSGPLTRALGADRVLVMSLLSYMTRFIIYALMQNPLQGLPAEALRGVTFAGFWSTATVYAHRISPPGMHATMLMVLNAMYGGLGQSLGAIIGGNMAGRYGTVKTFLYSALFNFAFVTCLVAYLSIRKESNFKNPTPIVPKGQAAAAAATTTPEQPEQESQQEEQEQPLLQVQMEEEQQQQQQQQHYGDQPGKEGQGLVKSDKPTVAFSR